MKKGYKDILQTESYNNILKKVGRNVNTFFVQKQNINFFYIIRKKRGYSTLHVYRTPYSVEIFESAQRLAIDAGCSALRFEPLFSLTTEEQETLPQGIKKTAPLQPAFDWCIGLDLSEEDILLGMHQKHRYNIKKFKESQYKISEEKNLETYLVLKEETERRQKFTMGDRAIVSAILQSKFSRQYTAFSKEGEAVASTIIYSDEGVSYYLYAASNKDGQKAFAPTGLLWYAIQKARESGSSFFNMTGIAPVCDKKDGDSGIQSYHNVYWMADHAYSGVTRIKVGFGGFPINHGSAYIFSCNFIGKILPASFV